MSVKIDQALINAVMTGGLEIDVIHDNGAYSVWDGVFYKHHSGAYVPDGQREYVEIKNFPAGRTAYTLANSDENVGMFQMIFRFPLDAGLIDGISKVEQALSVFAVGAVVSHDGQRVNVTSNNRDSGRVEGGFFQIVARVNWLSFTQR